LADPTDLEYEPLLLCIDLQAWEDWLKAGTPISGPSDRGSWCRCSLHDFFNQSGQPDTADQLTLFSDPDDFVEKIALFSNFALAMEQSDKESLFGIAEKVDHTEKSAPLTENDNETNDGTIIIEDVAESSAAVGSTSVESQSGGL